MLKPRLRPENTKTTEIRFCADSVALLGSLLSTTENVFAQFSISGGLFGILKTFGV